MLLLQFAMACLVAIYYCWPAGSAVLTAYAAWQHQGGLLAAIWFGNGNSWPVLLKKIFVDQFIYSLFWSNPFNAVATRWYALRYSGTKLWGELDMNFLTERVLPIAITGWLFWIPGVLLIYSMPTPLQVPLFIFATAIWGILLPAVAKQEQEVLTAEEEVVLS